MDARGPGRTALRVERHIIAEQPARNLDPTGADGPCLFVGDPHQRPVDGIAVPGFRQEMHAAIRAYLNDTYGSEVADIVPILYGGSVKPANAQEIFGKADVDGGLVGGASLKADSFADIINAFTS